jgi:MarR family 2-MHQ and catechol resistance regulon transcriptional repressor
VKIENELKQSKFQSNVHKAVVNIMFTNGWVEDQFRQVFKNHRITSQQYNVLRILRGKYPDSLNPSEIKSVMLDKNPDLTRLCDRLLKMEFIERCIDTKNKRKMNIRINDSGMELLKKIDPLITELNKNKFKLSEDEAMILSDLLDKIRG